LSHLSVIVGIVQYNALVVYSCFWCSFSVTLETQNRSLPGRTYTCFSPVGNWTLNRVWVYPRDE